MRAFAWHRTVRLCALAALMLFAGCQRVNSTADVASASQLVADRSGIAPHWQGAAPTWDPQTPLRRDLAIRLAFSRYPGLRAERATIAAARADFAQAGLLPNPMLSLFLGLEDGHGVSMVNAGVMQPLSALWLRGPRMRQADAELQQSILRAADAALMVIDQVDQSLARIRYHERACRNFDEQRELLDRAQKAAQDKLELGMGTAIDVSRVAADLLLLESERLAARAMLVQEKQELLKLIGAPQGDAAFTLAAEPDPSPLSASEREVIAWAKQQRLDLLAAGWSVKSARAMLVEARRAPWSGIDAGVEAERDSMGGDSAMTVVGPSLKMAVPVFDPGDARTAKAAAMLEKAQAQAETLEHAVIREVRSAYASLSAAQEQLHLYRGQILPRAEKNVADAQAAFDTGQLDLTDVLMARRQLALSQQKHLEFSRDAAIARSQLRRSIGGQAVRTRAATQPAKQD